MRVPVCARRCRRNWPLSLVGKKSCPSQGKSRKPHSAEREEKRHENKPAVNECGEQKLVGEADALEAAFKHALDQGERIACADASCDRGGGVNTWRGSVRACAKADRMPASRIRRLRREEQTDTSPRRSGKTWAGTRCRCKAWRRGRVRRSARRLRESPCAGHALPRDSA